MKSALLSIALATISPAHVDQLPLGLRIIIEFEGYHEQPYYDVNAMRAGYGTPSRIPLSRVAAAYEAYKYYAKAKAQVAKRFQCLEGQRLEAFAAFWYNVGRAGPTLQRALRQCDNFGIARAMRLYVHAAGKRLRGLERRREVEASYFLNL